MGPLGALVGGVMGAVYGYQCSDDYDVGIIQCSLALFLSLQLYFQSYGLIYLHFRISYAPYDP